MSQPLISVIIPAINEESRLPRTLDLCIEFLNKQNYTSEILVVTDGSKDRTEAIAESYRMKFPALRVISFPFNRGKGFAVKSGMTEAKGLYKLFMDADYAVPLDFVNSFIDASKKGYDVVIACRTHRDSKILQSQGYFRRQLAMIFRYLQQIILQLPYHDTQCGYKLFTAQAAKILFERMTFDCAFFDAELLYIGHKLKMKVYEHPVTWQHHPDTRLPIGIKRSLELVNRLFLIRKIHGSI